MLLSALLSNLFDICRAKLKRNAGRDLIQKQPFLSQAQACTEGLCLPCPNSGSPIFVECNGVPKATLSTVDVQGCIAESDYSTIYPNACCDASYTCPVPNEEKTVVPLFALCIVLYVL